ncbi:ArnT family glycosyltransferase [Bryocella elongata]|nr:hypothetical protein [Bryocella elongata]
MGDSGLVHYVVFLTHHGWGPYRDIIEINTPGAYLTEDLAMLVFGGGALGWRLFDFALLVLAGLGYVYLMGVDRRQAGFLAGTLFLTIHGQDGVMAGGQRDLTAAVLLISSACFALYATSASQARSRSISLLLAGICVGWATCLKPPLGIFVLLLVAWLWVQLRTSRNGLPLLLVAVGGSLCLPLVCLGFLLANQALTAYWTMLHGLDAYHLSLGRRTIGYLLLHSISPLQPLLLLTAATAIFACQRSLDKVDLLLLAGALVGLLSYITQRKGFSYQRYPFLIFLIALCLRRLFRKVPSSGAAAIFPPAAITLCVGMILLQTYKLSTYSRQDPDAPLLADIKALGIDHDSGSIQCLDTIGPCIESLYKAKLLPATGFFYDCYFESNVDPISLDQRRKFQQAMLATKPRWIILTESSCFNQPPSFDKFRDWPWLQATLASYSLVRQQPSDTLQRYWSRPEKPLEYRIYRREPNEAGR